MPRHNLKHNGCFFALLLVLSGLLFLLPGPPVVASGVSGFRAKAVVTETDNSNVEQHGLVRFGSQRLKVRITGGPMKGEGFSAGNELRAQLEFDNFYEVGDRVVVVSPKPQVVQGDVLTVQSYARSGWTFALFGIFCILLCIFGRLTGFNALLSFVFSCILIWKAIIPLLLRG